MIYAMVYAFISSRALPASAWKVRSQRSSDSTTFSDGKLKGHLLNDVTIGAHLGVM